MVSIIVPVYNAEKYISVCIDSILSQTYSNFELLLINDGSSDASGSICEHYANRDTRVLVFHKDNSGVSATRQYGLDNANGDYIIHVDPDDWIEPNMLETLYHHAVMTDADVVICDFYVDSSPEDSVYYSQRPSSLNCDCIIEDFFTRLHGACWNKMIRRSFIINNNLRFHEELCLCEDLLFNASLMKYKPKVEYIDNAFYHYDQYTNEHSLVRTYTRKTYEKDKLMFDIFDNEFSYNHNLRKIVNNNMGNLLVVRAYLSHIFTPIEFVRLCFPYRKYVLGYDQSLIEKVVLYSSCIGLYSVSELLRNWLTSIRSIFNHRGH